MDKEKLVQKLAKVKSRNRITHPNLNGTKGLTENENFENEHAGPTLTGNAGPMIEIDDARVDVLPDNFNDSQTSMGITEKDETLENIDTTHEQGNNGENGICVDVKVVVVIVCEVGIIGIVVLVVEVVDVEVVEMEAVVEEEVVVVVVVVVLVVVVVVVAVVDVNEDEIVGVGGVVAGFVGSSVAAPGITSAP